MRSTRFILLLGLAALACIALLWAPEALAAEGGKPADKPAEKPAPKPADDPAPKAADKPDGKPVAPPAVDKPAPAAGKKDDVELGTVTVTTATRTKGDVFSISRFVTVIEEETFRRMNLAVSVNALGNQLGCWVEHRTGTTGDAVVRGLSGGNLLTLVDGCSLSTFWGEGGFAGDDMYGKVDPDMVGRIEVIRGPGSVLYGSQALGAVINFISREPPIDFTKKDFKSGVRGRFRYGSGNTSFAWRAEAFGATPYFKFLVGASLRDLNDVRAGGDVGVLENTSGEDYNFDMRYDFLLAEGHTLTVTHQNVHRTHTHRYYRPTQDNTNDRDAVTAWYTGKISDFLTEVVAKVYWQYKQDRRRWKLSDSDPKIGHARIHTYQAELQGTMEFEGAGKHKLTAGTGYHLDRGESADDEQFTLRKAGWSVGPDGERMDGPRTDWHNWSLFVQDEWKPADMLTVLVSGRYDFFHFSVDPYSSKYYPPEYVSNPSAYGSLEEAQRNDDFAYDDSIVTGGIGFTLGLTKWWNAVANFTIGYRHWPPKFGVTQHGNGLYAPSREGANIYSYTAEVGFKWKHKKFEGEAVYYHTWWDGFVEWHPGSYLGQTWYDWNDNGTEDTGENILVREAAGQAYLFGVEIGGWYHFRGDGKALFDLDEDWMDGLSLYAGFMWNYGEDLTARRVDNPDIDCDDDWKFEPIRHTHPLRCLVKLKWTEPKKKNLWFELTADMVARYDRIPTGRMSGDVGYWRDPADSSSGKLRDYGLPGYTVLHLKAGWKATENLTLDFGAENLLNRRYRRAHSRADEMGVNVLLGIDVKF